MDCEEESNLDEEYKTRKKNSNEWDSISMDSNVNSINLLEFSSERKQVQKKKPHKNFVKVAPKIDKKKIK